MASACPEFRSCFRRRPSGSSFSPPSPRPPTPTAWSPRPCGSDRRLARRTSPRRWKPRRPCGRNGHRRARRRDVRRRASGVHHHLGVVPTTASAAKIVDAGGGAVANASAQVVITQGRRDDDGGDLRCEWVDHRPVELRAHGQSRRLHPHDLERRAVGESGQLLDVGRSRSTGQARTEDRAVVERAERRRVPGAGHRRCSDGERNESRAGKRRSSPRQLDVPILGGTTTATTSANGSAAFTNLSISGVAGARVLTFGATGLTSVTARRR